jgi:SSS family solute:Na+ symporter
VKLDHRALSIIALSEHAKDMAENMYRGAWSFLIVVTVTVVVSLMTKPRIESELNGLVRGCTTLPTEGDMPWIKRPLTWAIIIFVVFLALNIIFW